MKRGARHEQVRALRAVAIASASSSPRCFGGRVARRRLGARDEFDRGDVICTNLLCKSQGGATCV